MNGLRGPLWAALLFFMWHSSVLAEDPRETKRAYLEDTLEEAERLIVADPDDLQLDFIRGMALAELGRYLEAADEFRWMLTRDPSLMRPRLELGRVLVLSGQHDSARYNFEQVLAHELPDDVRRNILNVLARLRERTATFSVGVDLVTDSNPVQSTSAREVEIDGLRYRVSPDGRSKESKGVRVTFEGTLPLWEESLWFLRGNGELQEYSDDRANVRYLQLTAGRNFHLPDRTVTLQAGGHASSYGGDRLYEGALAAVSDYHQVREDAAVKIGVAAYQFHYHDYPYLSAWQGAAHAQGFYSPSSTSRWEALLGLVRNDAEEEAYSYLQAQCAGRYVKELVGGWIVGMLLSGAVSRYRAPDPIFSETRRDVEKKAQLDVANRRIRFWRLTPRLQLGHVDRDSNLDLYAFERTYVRLGLGGDF